MKSLGVLSILVKSLIESPRPNPSIISAKTIGAIFVTISIVITNTLRWVYKKKFNLEWFYQLKSVIIRTIAYILFRYYE